MLFRHLLEIFEIRSRLTFTRWHEVAVGTFEIGFLADLDEHVFRRANVFLPLGILFRVATVALQYGPGPGECIVDQRDLVLQDFWSGLAVEDALLDDRLVVDVGGHSGGIERAGTPS